MAIVDRMIKVEGLSCNECIEKIEASVLSENGVIRALGDLKEKQLYVEYDTNHTDVNILSNVIKKAGYDTII